MNFFAQFFGGFSAAFKNVYLLQLIQLFSGFIFFLFLHGAFIQKKFGGKIEK